MKIKWKCLFGAILAVVIGVPVALGSAVGLCYLLGWLFFDTGHSPINAVFGFFLVVIFVFLISLVGVLYEECVKKWH